MGPKQGPGICKGLNEQLFGQLDNVSIYVDDFHVGSDTFEEHLGDLEGLLKAGESSGVQWKRSKSYFCQPKCNLLGFEVSVEGRRPDPGKVKALKVWPVPTQVADIVSVLAFANYLREFIPDFEEIVRPLRPYARKGVTFEEYQQDAEAQKAFERLRNAVATEVPLRNPDYGLCSQWSSFCAFH